MITQLVRNSSKYIHENSQYVSIDSEKLNEFVDFLHK